MFNVNNFNTTATITNILETVNQSNNISNDNLLVSSPITSSAYATSNNNTTLNNNNSTLLTDLVVNSTAVMVDYASQWLTTTIATTAANLGTFPTHSPTDSILNYNTTPPYAVGSFTNFTYPAAADIINTTSLSSSATLMLNADLIGENPKLADYDNNYDDLDECHPKNPKFNCSRQHYIEFILGPQKLPLFKSLLITILYGCIFITGFFGNVLVCMVIFKQSEMHTTTNYYLFSLAVSDLIYLTLGLPMEVILYWHQYPYLFGLTFCKARAYISEALATLIQQILTSCNLARVLREGLSTYVSVLTIVAFSVERYIAICHPLHLCAMGGFKRASIIIAMLWLVSFFGAIPFGIWTKINYSVYPPDRSQINDSGYCGFDPTKDIALFEISSVVSFLIPMFLIFYFYGRMGLKIRSRTTQQLAAVVVTFFICWLPFHIQRLWYVYGKNHKYFQEVNEWLFSITGFAYYVTCTINPILYNVMSHRYREAFKKILCRKRKNVYYNNGFARDQSSFHETTNASSLCNSSTYDRVHSVRVRSVRMVNNVRDRSSIKFNRPIEKDIPENHSTNLSGTNAIVVCVDNGVNGRTKVFTENEAQETLLNKNNETCI